MATKKNTARETAKENKNCNETGERRVEAKMVQVPKEVSEYLSQIKNDLTVCVAMTKCLTGMVCSIEERTKLDETERVVIKTASGVSECFVKNYGISDMEIRGAASFLATEVMPRAKKALDEEAKAAKTNKKGGK